MLENNAISCPKISARRPNKDGKQSSVQHLSSYTLGNRQNQNDTMNPSEDLPCGKICAKRPARKKAKQAEELPRGMSDAKRKPKENAKTKNDFSKQADEELARWMKRFRAAELRIVKEQERRYEAKLKKQRQIDKEFGDLCEATEGLAKYWRDRDMLTPQRLLDYADGDAYCIMLIIPLLRKLITRIINRFQTALTRPLRYKKENKVRRRLAAERRKITKRKTTNPCPTVFQIFEAWEEQKKSHVHYLRLGALLEDLECYVDNSLRFDENGCIVGREHGIKGWIQENLDFLTGKYSSMMRCKATAKRLRQIANIKDPNSLLNILPTPNNSEETNVKNSTRKQHKVRESRTRTPRQNAIMLRSNFDKSDDLSCKSITIENKITMRSNSGKSNECKTDAGCGNNEIMVRSNLSRLQRENANSGLSENATLERDNSSESQPDKVVSAHSENAIMMRSNFGKSNECKTDAACGNNAITVRSNSHYPEAIQGEKSKRLVAEILDKVTGRRACLKDYFDDIIEVMEMQQPDESSEIPTTVASGDHQISKSVGSEQSYYQIPEPVES